MSGRRVADAAIVAEEMGRQVSPGPFCPVSVVTAALSVRPREHLGLLSSLISGATVASWAFAEPRRSWDARSVGATVERFSGGVEVNGVKTFDEAAPVAEAFLVAARTDGALTQVVVPASAEGVTVLPARSLDLARWFGEVRFDSVRLPATAVVGDVGCAAADVERQLEIAIALQCAETVGVLDRVFEFTREYMDDRYAFGRLPSSYQALSIAPRTSFCGSSRRRPRPMP